MKSKPIIELINDLSSLRAIWAHLYLLLFAGISIMVLLRYPDAVTPLIYSWSGTVGIIFTNYVVSRTYLEGIRLGKDDSTVEPKVGFNGTIEDDPGGKGEGDA